MCASCRRGMPLSGAPIGRTEEALNGKATVTHLWRWKKRTCSVRRGNANVENVFFFLGLLWMRSANSRAHFKSNCVRCIELAGSSMQYAGSAYGIRKPYFQLKFFIFADETIHVWNNFTLKKAVSGLFGKFTWMCVNAGRVRKKTSKFKGQIV